MAGENQTVSRHENFFLLACMLHWLFNGMNGL